MGLLKCGGALLIKLGVTNLSELEIDADKDWQALGIVNIAELVTGMAKGDIPVRDDAVIAALSPTPGSIGKKLTSQGPGALPIWS